MSNSILARRLGTDRAFRPGETLLLALGLATADLTAETTRILEDHGLGHTHYNVLRILRGAGSRGATHGDLTRWMIVGVPDITRLVDRMQRAGWVSRERDPDDRRRVIHRITPAGLELLGVLDPLIAEVHGWVEQALPEAERNELVAACERIIELAAARSGRELAS